MRTISTNCLTGSVQNKNLKPGSFLLVIFTIAATLLSSSVFAQTFPTSCTSKDLTLLSANLPAPANDRCACDGDRVLVLGIHNGTNSYRTSFALWGTLIRKDASGATIETKKIFACANGILGKTDNYLPASTIELDGVPVGVNASGQPIIHISCGQSLDITDLHLAWTSASPGETCDVLKAHPELINPKCGTLESIHVGIGVDATMLITDATCSTGGKIKVSPFGGLAPYTVSLDGGTAYAVAAGGYYEFTNVSAGAHTITIVDNTGKPVAERCSTTKSPNVPAPPTVTASAGDDFTKSCTQNENGKQIGEASATGYTFSWSPTTGLSSSTASNPTANPSSTTTYTVTKTNTATGCNDDDAVIVTVDKPTVTASAGSDFTKDCANNTSGKQIGEASAAGYTYSWSPTTGLSSGTVSNPTANPSSTTTYTVTKTHTSSGCYDTDDITVTVSTSAPTFTVCLVQPSLCAGTSSAGQATVNASGGTNYSYQLNSGAPQASNVFSSLGAGSLSSITVKNTDNGCSTTVNCDDLVIDCAAPTLAAPAKDVNAAVNINQSTVNAYPNPFNDQVKFVVNVPKSGNGSLVIYNSLGQKVREVYQGHINAGSQTFEMNLPGKQRAMLVYVFSMEGKQVTGKLVQSGN